MVREVEEHLDLELKKVWVVRIIQGPIRCAKKCIDEKDFLYEPTEEQIGEFLWNHREKDCFATVEELYRWEEVCRWVEV